MKFREYTFEVIDESQQWITLYSIQVGAVRLDAHPFDVNKYVQLLNRSILFM